MIVGSPNVGMMAGGRNTSSLYSVLSSACMDLDATISTSYGGSGQTWSNLVATPADSSSQTAYDFYLGATSGSEASDPAFTGSSGDPGAYFSHDGGDYYTIKAGTNPTLFSTMHRTSGGSPFWFLVAGQTPASISGNNDFFSDTVSTHGITQIRFSGTTNAQLDLLQNNGSGSVTVSSTATVAASTNFIAIVSADCALTSNNVRFWVNTRTKNQSSTTFGTTTTNASTAAKLGARVDAAAILANGYKIRTFAAGNTLIDDASAVLLINAINARHGITYA